jgi:serine/threonine-protein kinase
MGGFVRYRLQFPFLARWGRPFCVFDQNDSGNISFGVENESGERYFVKIAGARTKNAVVTPAQAVENLRRAVPLYEEMRHPNLIELAEHFAYREYYAAVFRWARGECFWDHWNWAGYAKTGQPRPFERFRALPLEKRLRAFDAVLSFFGTVEAARYVSVDFYLGTVMYDFGTDATTFCDIDLFLKQPCENTMGRMWGQIRFMVPEEWQLGASPTARVNVYRLGATAFVFLGAKEESRPGRGLDRNAEAWEASPALYEIAIRAAAPAPEDRYASVAEFAAAWNKSRQESEN